MFDFYKVWATNIHMCRYKMIATTCCQTKNSGWKNKPIPLQTLVTGGFNKTFQEQQQLKSPVSRFQMSEQFLNFAGNNQHMDEKRT